MSLDTLFELPFVRRGLLAAFLIGPLLGALGHIVIARRLAFLSAALGHAALTGLTIGLLLGEPIESPLGGIFGFTLLSALAMVYVRRRTSMPSDTLIGVFLALTLGLGICLLVAVTKYFNIHQIEAVMFGSLITVTDADLVVLAVVALVVVPLLIWKYNQLLLDSVNPELAAAAGVNSAVIDYGFVLLLTMVIVVSLKIVGALLVEALIIVPAASARNIARSTRGMMYFSVLFAWLGAEGGIALSTEVKVPSGGAVVLVLGAIYFVTLLAGRARA